MKKFAAFDIDGTLIRWQLFHAIVHSLGKQGYLHEDEHQAIRQARAKWKNRTSKESFAHYEQLLVDTHRDALVKIPTTPYLLAVEEVFDEYKDQLFVFTRDLLKDLKNQGYLLFAISGSQNEVVQKFANYHGFDDAIGTALYQSDGQFTGEYYTPVEDKAHALNSLVKKHGATFVGSYAVGDSASDIAMLQLVENPIAFNPEDKLFNEARQKDWRIVVERKNVIYDLSATAKGYILK